MLSIIDLLDFIDLDRETVQVVNAATHLSDDKATEMAEELLKTHRGIHLIHEMFRDQIAEAASSRQLSREKSLRRAYAYFARKYPMPRML